MNCENNYNLKIATAIVVIVVDISDLFLIPHNYILIRIFICAVLTFEIKYVLETIDEKKEKEKCLLENKNQK